MKNKLNFECFNKDLNIKSVSLKDLYILPNVIKLIPKEVVRKYGIIPFKVVKNKLLVAMENPYDEMVKEEIRFITGMEVIPYIDTKYNIFSAIESYYEKQTVNEVLEDLKNVKYMVKANKNENEIIDRKSTRLNSSHANISYAVFCLKKKNDRFFHRCPVP